MVDIGEQSSVVVVIQRAVFTSPVFLFTGLQRWFVLAASVSDPFGEIK